MILEVLRVIRLSFKCLRGQMWEIAKNCKSCQAKLQKCWQLCNFVAKTCKCCNHHLKYGYNHWNGCIYVIDDPTGLRGWWLYGFDVFWNNIVFLIFYHFSCVLLLYTNVQIGTCEKVIWLDRYLNHLSFSFGLRVFSIHLCKILPFY